MMIITSRSERITMINAIRLQCSVRSVFILALLTAAAFIMLIPASPASATSFTQAAEVHAKVNPDITLEIIIIDKLYNRITQTMDFGDLQKVGEEYRSATYYQVQITAAANTDPFEVRQSATALVRSGGFETIPTGAYIAKIPTLDLITTISGDQQTQGAPAGAKVGETGTAVRDILIYQSDDRDNKKVMIPVDYTLSGDSALKATQIIPINQKSGSYSGTVMFTITSR